MEVEMRTSLRIWLLVTMIFFSIYLPVSAAILTVTGEFDPVVCITDKGKIYAITSGQPVSISIDDVGNENRWVLLARVDIQSPFAKDLDFMLRRTSEGFGPGYVQGGWSFTPVRMVDTRIFSGWGSIFDVELQMKIPEISASFPEGPLNMKLVLKVVTLE